MLTNIVENALKYGAGSGTQVRITGGHERRHDVSRVWLQVADDGPGIPAAQLPHVCERFYRGDRARTHRADAIRKQDTLGGGPIGSGLGLSISQCIAGDHGGALRVQSEHGHGVVVDIWLPARDMREG
jgi:two-component system OmpR family sensor kinase